MNKNLLVTAALAIGTIGFGACGSTATNTVSTGNNANTAVVVNKPANAIIENANVKPADAPVENVNMKPSNAAVDLRRPNKDEAALSDTSANDKIGVPECDDYIAKYEACVNSKVPAAERANLISAIEMMRKGWKNAATNAPARAALPGGCKVALATAKDSMSKYSCDW